MNTYLAVSSLINLLAALLLITFLLSSGKQSPVRRQYVNFLYAVLGWAAAYFLWRISESEVYAEMYCKMLTSSAGFLSITFYHFCLILAGAKTPRTLAVGYVIAVLLVVFTCFGWIVAGVSPKAGHLFWPDAGILMPLYLAYFTFYFIASGWVLIRAGRQHLGRRASDHLYVLCSTVVGFIGGSTNFPLWYDIPIQPYGNVLVAIYSFTVAYGLYSNRISGIRMDVSKAAFGLFLNLSVALFYLLFAGLYRTIFSHPYEPYEMWMHGVAAFCVSSVVFWGVPRLKFKMEKVLEGVFRSERASALSRLKDLPTKLTDITEDEAIFEMTADTVMQSLDVTGVAVCALEPFDSAYRCAVSAGIFSRMSESPTIDVDNPIVEVLNRQAVCVVLDQIYEEMNQYYYQALVDLRNDLKVSVIVPIFANHEVYGLILLGPPKQPRVWSEEEISILFSVGAQIGINFRTRDFERRASEVDKLVALGTMAAGLAHEIRNPLVSVQTLSSMIQTGKSLTRVSEQFKDVLLRDVKRIASIVEGVALYSQNQKGKMAQVSINTVLSNSIDISSDLAKEQGVVLSYKPIGDEDMLISANMGQLVQVFGNLIENAIQALSGSDIPAVKISVTKRKAYRRGGQSWLEVVIADNGPGIPKAILDRVFDPFITSKDTGARDKQMGMGLGLAISKRIIENHNGAITVSNDPKGGAKFMVSLKWITPKDEKTTS